jgi:transcriptional regulator with XRE-family HTH domain
MMGRDIEEIIAALPKERRSRIKKVSRQMAREMVAYADSLAEVRRAFSKTQAEVGAGLGLPQNAVSQLEKRKDMRLSTLARYVGALGGELDVIIRLKDGSEMVLKGVGDERKTSQREASLRPRGRPATRG